MPDRATLRTGRRRARAGAAASAGALALGCGGIWREAVADSFSEMTAELEQSVPATDPNRARAEELIDAGWLAAWEGEIGLFDSIGFAIDLDEARMDGRLTDGEVVRLTDNAQPFVAATLDLDPKRRADLLLIKADRDEIKRRELGATARPLEPDAGRATRIETWSLPDDVPDAIERAGWRVASCANEAEPEIVWVQCRASLGEQHASVTVERYADPATADRRVVDAGGVLLGSGATDIEVVVLDNALAAELRDAVVGATDLVDLDETSMRSAMTATGWSMFSCDGARDAESISVSCTGTRDRRVGSVDLVKLLDAPGGPERKSEHDGIAEVQSGPNSLIVRVREPDAASALASALVR